MYNIETTIIITKKNFHRHCAVKMIEGKAKEIIKTKCEGEGEIF